MDLKNDNKYIIGVKTKELNFKSLANLAILMDKMDLDTKPVALDLK